jgi:hypothetical protein
MGWSFYSWSRKFTSVKRLRWLRKRPMSQA